MLLDLFIADAVATPFEGLSEGHIKSAKLDFENYFDTRTLLKDHPDKWCKPGLYSSVAAAGFVCAASALIAPENPDFFVSNCGKKISSDSLRSPDSFLLSLGGGDQFGGAANYISLYASLYAHYCSDLSEERLLSFIFTMTRDAETLTSAFMAANIVQKKPSTMHDAYGIVHGSLQWCLDNQPLFFKGGYHPDLVIKTAGYYDNIFTILKKNDDKTRIWKEIFAYVSNIMSRNVVRPTIYPMTLLPYTLDLALRINEAHTLLQMAVAPGASTRASALFAVLMSRISLADELPTLLSGLVNRRKIIELSELAENGNISLSVMDEFLKGEEALTRKEREERNALLKHSHKKIEEKKKNRTKSTKELTTHVVESWTKVDKARYRKQIKRTDVDDEND